MRVPSVSITPAPNWGSRVTSPGDDARAIGFSGVYLKFHRYPKGFQQLWEHLGPIKLWDFTHPDQYISLAAGQKSSRKLMPRTILQTPTRERISFYFYIQPDPLTNRLELHMTDRQAIENNNPFARKPFPWSHLPPNSYYGEIFFTGDNFAPMLEFAQRQFFQAEEQARQVFERSGILKRLHAFLEKPLHPQQARKQKSTALPSKTSITFPASPSNRPRRRV